MTRRDAARVQEQPKLVNRIFVCGFSVKRKGVSELLVGGNLVKFLLKRTQQFHINYMTGLHHLFIGVSLAKENKR